MIDYKLLNAIFLVAGTAIGAGLIALPITAINLGTVFSSLMMLGVAFIAFHSAGMLIRLDESIKRPLSIVELSKLMSGRTAFFISILSFYLLSCALLAVYFSGIEDCLSNFFNLNRYLIIFLCSAGLWLTLNLKTDAFSRLNSLLFIVLIATIVIIIVRIGFSGGSIYTIPLRHAQDLFVFLPIAFTSFGVQNICAYLYEYLQKDLAKIRIALAIGIAIPLVLYILWTSCVFTNISTYGGSGFVRLFQNHQISVGKLINFLCACAGSAYMEHFFRLLTLTTIATSAIGIGIGLLHSVRESVVPSKYLANLIICLIPAICVIAIPNAFIRILSIGGIIAVVWVVFMPYYLIKRQYGQTTIADKLCLLSGIVIVLSEWFSRY